MLDRSDRFDRVWRSTNITLRHQVDVLYNNQVVVEDLTIGSGRVNVNRARAALRALDLTVQDPTLIPSTTSPLMPYGFELRVQVGVEFVPGDYELIPQGVFPINRSAAGDRTLETRIKALDRSERVRRTRFEEDWLILDGTPPDEAIMALVNPAIPGCEYLFPDLTGTMSRTVLPAWRTDRWAVVRQIAEAWGCWGRFDPLGRLVTATEPSFENSPVVWTYADDEMLVSADVDVDDEEIVNRVVATGGNSTTGQYRGQATDDNPLSPTFYNGPCGPRAVGYHSDFFTSNEQCEAAAIGQLAARRGRDRNVDFKAMIHPAHEGGDVVVATSTSLGVNELYMLEEFDIALTPADVGQLVH